MQPVSTLFCSFALDRDVYHGHIETQSSVISTTEQDVITMASDFSRRQFLTAGTAFGATLGLAGLVGCAPKTAPQPQSGQTGTADQGAAATSAKAVSTSSRLIDVREQEVVATKNAISSCAAPGRQEPMLLSARRSWEPASSGWRRPV